jgi:archaellum component FlaC
VSGLSNWSPVLVIVLGYVLGFHFQDRRIDDLRGAMNQRFGGINQRFDDMNQRFTDLNQRFNSIDARFSDLRDFIKAEISRLEDRVERLEHPVARP